LDASGSVTVSRMALAPTKLEPKHASADLQLAGTPFCTKPISSVISASVGVSFLRSSSARASFARNVAKSHSVSPIA
jgi:hypothetical protein